MEFTEMDKLSVLSPDGVYTFKVPEPIARIRLCGALTFTITDDMAFNCPTEEQIRNLKETFNIEVEILDEYK